MAVASLPAPAFDDFLLRGSRRRASSAQRADDGPLSPISAFVRSSLSTRPAVSVQNPVSLRGASLRGESPAVLSEANMRELSREEMVQRSRSATQWFREIRTINQMARPMNEIETALADARRRRAAEAAVRASSEVPTRAPGLGRCRSKEAPAPPPGPELPSGSERGREKGSEQELQLNCLSGCRSTNDPQQLHSKGHHPKCPNFAAAPQESLTQGEVKRTRSLMEKFGHGSILKTKSQNPFELKGDKFFNIVKEVHPKGFADIRPVENTLLERLRKAKELRIES